MVLAGMRHHIKKCRWLPGIFVKQKIQRQAPLKVGDLPLGSPRYFAASAALTLSGVAGSLYTLAPQAL